MHQAVLTPYASNGRQSGSAILLSNYLTPGSKVSISADARGGAVVLFEEDHTDVQKLIADRIANGSVAQSIVVASEQVAEDMSLGTVAADAAGGFYIGYAAADGLGEGTNTSMYTRYFAPGSATGSTTMESEYPRSSSDYGGIVSINLIASADGSSATYADETGGGLETVHYGRITTSARTVHGEIDENTNGVLDPGLALNTDGSFEIALLGGTFPQPAIVERFNAAGNRVARQDVTIDAASSEATQVTIAAMPDNGYVTTVLEIHHHTSDTIVTRYAADGTLDESGPLIVAADSTTTDVGVDADSVGNAVVSSLSKQGNIVVRRLTSGVAVDGGELYVIGTAGRDSLDVSANSTRIVVTRDGVVSSFPIRKIGAISMGGLAGNDRLTNETDLPATLVGGSGHDAAQGNDDDVYESIEDLL